MSKRDRDEIESVKSARNPSMCMGKYKKLRKGPRKQILPVEVLNSVQHPYEV